MCGKAYREQDKCPAVSYAHDTGGFLYSKVFQLNHFVQYHVNPKTIICVKKKIYIYIYYFLKLISTTGLTPIGEERKKKRLKSLDTIRG